MLTHELKELKSLPDGATEVKNRLCFLLNLQIQTQARAVTGHVSSASLSLIPLS